MGTAGQNAQASTGPVLEVKNQGQEVHVMGHVFQVIAGRLQVKVKGRQCQDKDRLEANAWDRMLAG